MKPLSPNHAPVDELGKEKEDNEGCEKLSVNTKEELSEQSIKFKSERNEEPISEELKSDKEFENFPKSTSEVEGKDKDCEGLKTDCEAPKEFPPELKSKTKKKNTSKELIKTVELNEFSPKTISDASHFFESCLSFLYHDVPENVNSLELYLSELTNRSVENDLDVNCTKIIEVVEEKSDDKHKIYSSLIRYHIEKKSSMPDKKVDNCEDIVAQRIFSENQQNPEIDLQMNKRNITLYSNEYALNIATDYVANSSSEYIASSKPVASTSLLQTEAEKALNIKYVKRPSSTKKIKNKSSPTVVQNIPSIENNNKAKSKELFASVAESLKTNKVSNQLLKMNFSATPYVSLTDMFAKRQAFKNQLKDKNDMSYVNRIISLRSNDCTDAKDKDIKSSASLKIKKNARNAKNTQFERKDIKNQFTTCQDQCKNLNRISCKGSNDSTLSEVPSTSVENKEMESTLKLGGKSGIEQTKSEINIPRKDTFQQSKVKEVLTASKDCKQERKCEPTIHHLQKSSTPVKKKALLNNLNSPDAFQKSKKSVASSSVPRKTSTIMELLDKIRGPKSPETSVFPIQGNYIQDFLAKSNKVGLMSPNKQTSKSLELNKMESEKKSKKTDLSQSNDSSVPIHRPSTNKLTPERNDANSKLSIKEVFKDKTFSGKGIADKSSPKREGIPKLNIKEEKEDNTFSEKNIDKSTPKGKSNFEIREKISAVTDKSTLEEKKKSNCQLSITKELRNKSFSEESITNKSPSKRQTNSKLSIKEVFKDKTFLGKGIADKSSPKREGIPKLNIKEEKEDDTFSEKNIDKSTLEEKKKSNCQLSKELRNKSFSEESITNKSPSKRQTNYKSNIIEELKDNSFSKESVDGKTTLEKKKRNSKLSIHEELRDNVPPEKSVSNMSACDRKSENLKSNIDKKIEDKACTTVTRKVKVRAQKNQNLPLRRSPRNLSKNSPSLSQDLSCKSSVKNIASSKKERSASSALPNMCESNTVNRRQSAHASNSKNESSPKRKRSSRKHILDIEEKLDTPENIRYSANESSLKSKKRPTSVEFAFNCDTPVPKRHIKPPSNEDNRLQSEPKKATRGTKRKKRHNVTGEHSNLGEFSGDTTEGINPNVNNSNANIDVSLINPCQKFCSIPLKYSDQRLQNSLPEGCYAIPTPPNSYIIYNSVDNTFALYMLGPSRQIQSVQGNPVATSQNLSTSLVPYNLTTAIASQNFASAIASQSLTSVPSHSMTSVPAHSMTSVPSHSRTSVPSHSMTSVVAPQRAVSYSSFQSSLIPNFYANNQLNSNIATPQVLRSQNHSFYNASNTTFRAQNNGNINMLNSGLPSVAPGTSFQFVRQRCTPLINMPPPTVPHRQNRTTRANTRSTEVRHNFKWEIILNGTVKPDFRSVYALCLRVFNRKFNRFTVTDFCTNPERHNRLIGYMDAKVLWTNLDTRELYNFPDNFCSAPFLEMVEEMFFYYFGKIDRNENFSFRVQEGEQVKSIFVSELYASASYATCYFFGVLFNAVNQEWNLGDLLSCLASVCMLNIFCEFKRRELAGSM